MTPASAPHEPPSSTRGKRPLKSMEVRTVASGTLGSALEYFDFATYGVLSATVFPQLFFHQLGSTGGLLASFATFGVGVAARPLGAVLFGHLGDKIGRKPILFVTLALMGASSILIGFLPTGRGIGIAALLVALRFIQGVSLGGEATGGQILSVEHCDRSRRGLMGSFVVVGSPLSQVLGNLVIAALSASLSEDQFLSWGWRVPFIGSLVIVATAVFIRLKLEETPAFANDKDAGAVTSADDGSRSAGIHVLKTHPRQVIGLMLAWAGTTLSFYLVAVYGLSYLPSATGMSDQTATVIMVVANGLSALFAIAGGYASDRIGRRNVWHIGLGGCFVGIVLFFTAAVANPVLSGAIVALVMCSIQFLSGAQPALFAEQFPTKVRFTGMALAYTGANVLFAAPAPFVAAGLTALGGGKLVMAVNLLVLVVSAVAVSTCREGGDRDLSSDMESVRPSHKHETPPAMTVSNHPTAMNHQ
ncbi:MFS transporter [Streptomyces sp. GZWMJZ-114]|uniref:MFS transporter n=1 Tax=Streptomyces sp. GZWMJZ-114 TaxID=2494734 RepID=UPI0010118C98|nr:MFS transporter [Streptomyces sp. GZWMJZ-114]